MHDSNADLSVYASQYPEVLVVSGDLGLSRFLTEGLFPDGFWMSAVGSGLQALEVFRLRGFDAIIIDAAVSDLPLDELIARLRTTTDSIDSPVRQSARTPIVVIAGVPQELDPFDLDPLCIDGLFIAPFELSEVASKLREIRIKKETS